MNKPSELNDDERIMVIDALRCIQTRWRGTHDEAMAIRYGKLADRLFRESNAVRDEITRHFRNFVLCVRGAANRVEDAVGPEAEFVISDVESDLESALKYLNKMRAAQERTNG